MEDYYIKGEERFGPITSPLYWFLIKIFGAGIYKFVVKDLSKEKAERLLDVGTGPGDVPMMLEKAHNFDKIYAVDPSKQMISIARWRARGNPNLAFELGSSRSVPFEGRFKIVISVLSYHHWKAREFSLKYLSRLLEPGGEIRFYEYDRKKLQMLHRFVVSSHSLDVDDLKDRAGNAGLRIKDITRRGMLIRVTLIKRV